MSDQDRISPYNINTKSRRQVMRIKKNLSIQECPLTFEVVTCHTGSKYCLIIHKTLKWSLTIPLEDTATDPITIRCAVMSYTFPGRTLLQYCSISPCRGQNAVE
ncbi:hypothetical protein pdam_00022845 [Pocillopora damicornis]|uniref:Uncharacterized protein n=1 Tax=Pocillopora damicornis TaxID=46731 RepID=A0A3M6T460_POCDA|nr:hypothetical protein pdam_00022845 [Pocillopora damicornis]